MKKSLLTITFIAGITLMFSFSNAGYNDCSPLHSAGPPAGYAGDPLGGNKTCNVTTCHTGPTLTTQTGWITSNIPGTGYIPGTTYTIVATATRSNHTRFGFQISPQSAGGTVLGTLIVADAVNTQLTTGNAYIEQTSAGTTGTSGFHTWTFNWTAPVSGSGNLTFYGAFNVTNSSNNAMGDTIYKSTLNVSENTSVGIKSVSMSNEAISVYPNPVVDNINVKYNLTEAARTEIKIVDLQGKTIEVFLSASQGTGQYDYSFNIDRSKYAKGFYFVKVSANDRTQIKAILLQ